MVPARTVHPGKGSQTAGSFSSSDAFLNSKLKTVFPFPNVRKAVLKFAGLVDEPLHADVHHQAQC